MIWTLTEIHYTVKDWPAGEDWGLGKHNVENASLMNAEKVLLLPLHTMFGPLKNFV